MSRHFALSCAVLLVLASACSRTGLHVPAPTDAGADAGFDAGLDAGLDAGCELEVELSSRRTPALRTTVVLIVDASSSMNGLLSMGFSRWEALEDALVGDEGVAHRLDGENALGVLRYQGTLPCPELAHRPARLGAFDEIADLLAAPPSGSTPTDDAIAWARMNLDLLLPDPTQPVSFVLATDGEPNPCDGELNLDRNRQRVVDEVVAARGDDIHTYVLGIGASGISDEHLAQVAEAGSGREGARFWRATDYEGLIRVLGEAVDEARDCDGQLPWAVGMRCAGEVTLDGRTLSCGEPGGYTFDGDTIRVSGEACTAWQSDELLRVRVDCGDRAIEP